MKIKFFQPRVKATDSNLIADGELFFDDEADPEQLRGLRLTGISIRSRHDKDELYVTLPSHEHGSGPGRRWYEFLRSGDRIGSQERINKFRAWVLNAFDKQGATAKPVVRR